MLDLSGALRLTIDGQDVDVSAEGLVVRAEIARPRRFLRSIGVGIASVFVLRRLSAGLARYQLTLVVTNGGRPLVRIGSGVRSGWVGRLLRIPHLRFQRK